MGNSHTLQDSAIVNASMQCSDCGTYYFVRTSTLLYSTLLYSTLLCSYSTAPGLHRDGVSPGPSLALHFWPHSCIAFWLRI